MNENISKLLFELKLELAKEFKRTDDSSCYWAVIDSLNETANEISNNPAADSFELMGHSEPSRRYDCPNCGGHMIGDGYKSPSQCENADVPFDVEPDSGPYYCNPSE